MYGCCACAYTAALLRTTDKSPTALSLTTLTCWLWSCIGFAGSQFVGANTAAPLGWLFVLAVAVLAYTPLSSHLGCGAGAVGTKAVMCVLPLLLLALSGWQVRGACHACASLA